MWMQLTSKKTKLSSQEAVKLSCESEHGFTFTLHFTEHGGGKLNLFSIT